MTNETEAMDQKRVGIKSDYVKSIVVTDDVETGSYNNWPNDQGFDTIREETKEIELRVTGTFPAYAAGTVYRTGPGSYDIPTVKGNTVRIQHWFDGLTQVHRFQIKPVTAKSGSTKVIYNSRYTVDSVIENIRSTGKLNGMTFAQRDPCESFFKKIMSAFCPSKPDYSKPDARNVGVTVAVNFPGLAPGSNPVGREEKERGTRHSSGISTLHNRTDANIFQQLDPETLEPIGLAKQTALHPSLKGPTSAAHARTDHTTGQLYSFNFDFSPTPTYRIFSVDASKNETTILATITGTEGAYIHSLLLTENYVILCVWGSHYAFKGLHMLWSQNILDGIQPFDSTKQAKWFVVDRHGQGVVAVYETDPFFCFHTVNAWEETSSDDPTRTDIVADLVAYENLDVLKRFYYHNLKSTSPSFAEEYEGVKGDSARPAYTRFRLPGIVSNDARSGSKIASSQGCTKADTTNFKHSCSTSTRKGSTDFAVPKTLTPELPTYNSHYNLRPHRYTYGIVDRGLSTFVDGIVKLDAATQQATFWSEHGQSPGEAIFVPDPDVAEREADGEDKGVLLSVVLDGHRGTSYLLCLDARTMTELGRAELPGAGGKIDDADSDDGDSLKAKPGRKGVVGFGFHGVHWPERSAQLVDGGSVSGC